MSRKLLAILVVIILIVALAIPIAFLLSQEEERVDSDVRISEVMYDPFGDDAGQEWIELFNAGEEAQDLGGMTVVNRTGEVLCTIADVMLSPGAYFVVSLSTGEDVLRNQGDEVAVSVGEMKKATIVDFICWSAEDGFQPGNPHDTAIEAAYGLREISSTSAIHLVIPWWGDSPWGLTVIAATPTPRRTGHGTAGRMPTSPPQEGSMRRPTSMPMTVSS